MSASAMFGNALVGFRSDTTILLQWESSFTGIFTGKFLAYQMPECQAAYFLRRSKVVSDLTSWLLAYQMPSLAIFDPNRRCSLGISAAAFRQAEQSAAMASITGSRITRALQSKI
jgi:hypothetical protein